MARKIQFKRGPKSRLAKLSPAEMAFTDDEKKLYVGDGNENIRLLDQKDKTEITAALAKKSNENEVRKKSEPIGLNDAGSDLLTAIQGGTTVEVLSIPREQSVTPNKTTFFEVNNLNLFDKTKVIPGKQLQTSDGSMFDKENFNVTDFIPVTAGMTLYQMYQYDGAFYDENKNYLSAKNFGTTSFVVPNGAYYYRSSVDNSRINTYYVSTRNEYTPYGYTEFTISDPNLKNKFVEIVKEQEKPIEPNATTFLTEKVSNNVFDKSKAIIGKAIDSSGNLYDHATYNATDFMTVLPNTLYYQNSKGEGVFYDADKKIIGTKGFGVLSFTSPSRAKFYRTSIETNMLETGYVSTNNSFEPYGERQVIVTDDALNTYFMELAAAPPSKGNKWGAVGDSITEVNNRTAKNYHSYIADELGLTVTNLGVGGTGYKRTEENGTAFYQRIQNIPTDLNVVTIFGSGNDLSLTLGSPTDTGTETLCGCINTTLDRYYSRMPTTPIGIITPTPWDVYPNSQAGNKMELYANALIEICKRRSIPCLDLYRCSNLRPWDSRFKELMYSRDEGNGVHPDEKGHKVIATKIREFIKTLI